MERTLPFNDPRLNGDTADAFRAAKRWSDDGTTPPYPLVDCDDYFRLLSARSSDNLAMPNHVGGYRGLPPPPPSPKISLLK